MNEWRLLHVETPENAGLNIAIDEAILLARTKKIIPPTIRFWRNYSAVIIGYSQCVDVEVNLELCAKKAIQVIRRFSGGGAVYQDLGNLNYTLVLDAGHKLIRNLDIGESYRIFCSGIIEGLKEFGLTAKFSPLSDIIINDKKISGSAQSRKRGTILHHGTLLVDTDLNLLEKALNVPQEKIGIRKATSIKKPVTTLRNELDIKIDIMDIKNAIAKGFEKAFCQTLKVGQLSSKEKETAQNLYKTKYSQKKWTFKR